MMTDVEVVSKKEFEIEEVEEAMEIVYMYQYITDRLNDISSSISKLETLKNNLIDQFDAARSMEEDLIKRCKEKYGSSFDITKHLINR